MQLQAPELALELQTRLAGGQHLTLLGPRGSGKSTLVARIHSQLVAAGIPCAHCPLTRSLDDITRALESAYPGVETAGMTRGAARTRLWAAADRHAGVLLLDHFSSVSNAMVFFLKRLHGKVAGVLTVVDLESERDRSRMRRPSRYGAMCVRMPSTPPRQLRRLLYALTGDLGLPTLAPSLEERLLKRARGRPGWIVKCAELACDPRYWCEHGLLLTALCIDTEAAVRYRALDLLRPPGRACAHAAEPEQSLNTGASAASGLITPKQAGV